MPLGREQAVNDVVLASATATPGTCSAPPPPTCVVRENGRSTRILFSGDVGRFDAVLTKDPELAPDADYLVIESTYGNRTHPEISVIDQLEGVLKKTFARGGVLLIPAFAVGRAQQMIWLMDQLVTEGRLRPFPIHVDSPMAIDATRIYASYPDAHRVSLNGIGGRSLLYGKWVHLHRTRAESEALNDMKGPAVIISSSGMLSGGRILHHCRVRLPKQENTLLITGYQAAGTLGRALLDGASTRAHPQGRGAGAGRDPRPQGPVRARRRGRDAALALGRQGPAADRVRDPRRSRRRRGARRARHARARLRGARAGDGRVVRARARPLSP